MSQRIADILRTRSCAYGAGSRPAGFYGTGSAALSLNFTTGSLDSRITFSRPSLATMYDSTGKLTYAPNNLLTYSQDFSSWTLTGSVARTTGQTDPNGGTTAAKFVFSASGSANRVGGAVPSKPAGASAIQSIWLKGEVGGEQIVLSDINLASTTVTLTTSWVRYSYVYTVTSSSSYGFWPSSGTPTIYAAFAQLEAVTYQTTPSTYVATTSAAYYGPRFDYNPSTLAARGLLIEEARTNIQTYSQDFSNAAWTTFNGATKVGVAGAVAPDGTSTAYEITTGSTGGSFNSASAIYAGFASTSGVTYTVSLWVRAKTGTATIRVGMFVTSSYDSGDISVSTTWQRITVTGASTLTGTGNMSIRPSVAGTNETVYVWGAQVEAGSFATSYIPTGSSSVARSADSVSITGSNFSSWYGSGTAGTFAVESYNLTAVTNGNQYLIGNNAGGQILIWQNFGTGRPVVSDPSTLNGPSNSMVAGGLNKVAYGWSGSGRSLTANNNTPTTDSAAGPTLTQISLGSNAGANSFLNGTLKSLAYYRTRLADTRLQALTS